MRGEGAWAERDLRLYGDFFRSCLVFDPPLRHPEMVLTPLEAGYKAWLAEHHGFEIIEEDVQQKLVDYFVKTNRAISSRPTNVQDRTLWEEYWRDVLHDAGVTGRMNTNGFIR